MNTNTKPAAFNPATFSVRERALLVLTKVDGQGHSGRFIRDFGTTWKKIPGFPNHRFIGNAEKQLYATLWMGDDENPPSVAIYSGVAIDKFKEAFLNGSEAECRQEMIALRSGVMYAGGKVMMEMTALGLWQ